MVKKKFVKTISVQDASQFGLTFNSDIASSSVVMLPRSSDTFLARSLSNLFRAGLLVIYLVPSGLILTFHSQLGSSCPPEVVVGGGGGNVGGGGGA